MAELKPFRHGYYLWKYLPSIPAAAIFMILFSSITVAHCWRLYRTRKWFCIPFAIGGFMEFVGYAARISAHSKTDRLMPFAIQSSYILLAPVLFAATIYMTLSRIICALGLDHLSYICPRRLSKVFVSGDVLTLCIQAGASGLMFNMNTVELGNGIILGGLVLQLVMFGLFTITAVMFHVKARRATRRNITPSIPWIQTLYVLYTISVLIMIRSLFRVIEFADGQNGYLLSHEWTLYIFDSLPMWGVMMVFCIWYPGHLVPAQSEPVNANSLCIESTVDRPKH